MLGEQLRFVGSDSDSEIVGWADGVDHTDHILAFLQRLLSRDAVIYDVGANLGLYAAGFALMAREGRVIAFEPVPRVVEHLKHNVEGFSDRVDVEPVACGDRDGEIEFHYTTGFSSGSCSTVDGTYATGDMLQAETIRVPSTRLDSYTHDHGIERLDLIKIDVEGAELQVLDGADAIIRRFQPQVVLEFNHLALTAHQRLLPQDALERILDRFPYVYVFDRRTGGMAHIGNDRDVYRFLWQNAVFGPVDNLLCRFTPLPHVRGVEDTWIASLANEPAPSTGPTYAELQQEVNAMKRTISWRVTAPLRWVRARQRR